MSGIGKAKKSKEVVDPDGLTIPEKAEHKSGRRPAQKRRKIIKRILTPEERRPINESRLRKPVSTADADLDKDPDPDRAHPPEKSGERAISGRPKSGVIEIDEEGNLIGETRYDVGESLANVRPEAVVGIDAETGEIVIEQAFLDDLRFLLSANTLEAHREALELIKKAKLQAKERWQELHTEEDPDKRHEFSRNAPEKVNDFARYIAEKLNFQELSKEVPREKYLKLLELGAGYGNDARYWTKHFNVSVTGIDSSPEAMKSAAKGTFHRPLEENHPYFEINDYHNYLRGCLNDPTEEDRDIIYSCSTLHYEPPEVLKQITFPLIARNLKPDGKFCMAMKLSSSDSAQEERHYRVAANDNGDPYNSSIDKKEGIYRLYPNTPDDIRALLELSFNIDSVEVREVEGYDHKGQKEVFCYIIATPKPKHELPKPPKELPKAA